MNNDFLQDSTGNKSSKRLWGSIILGVGIIFSIILFGFSIARGANDASTAMAIINMFLLAGSSLLGISIFENPLKKSGKK